MTESKKGASYVHCNVCGSVASGGIHEVMTSNVNIERTSTCHTKNARFRDHIIIYYVPQNILKSCNICPAKVYHKVGNYVWR